MAREIRDVCDIGGEDEDVSTWVLTSVATGEKWEIDLCSKKHGPHGTAPPTLAKLVARGRRSEAATSIVRDQATRALIGKMRNRPNGE